MTEAERKLLLIEHSINFLDRFLRKDDRTMADFARVEVVKMKRIMRATTHELDALEKTMSNLAEAGKSLY